MLTPFWPSSVAPTHAHAHAHAHARIASTSNDRRMVLPPTPAARSNNGTRERATRRCFFFDNEQESGHDH
jgi:hypothetical protein